MCIFVLFIMVFLFNIMFIIYMIYIIQAYIIFILYMLVGYIYIFFFLHGIWFVGMLQESVFPRLVTFRPLGPLNAGIQLQVNWKKKTKKIQNFRKKRIEKFSNWQSKFFLFHNLSSTSLIFSLVISLIWLFFLKFSENPFRYFP